MNATTPGSPAAYRFPRQVRFGDAQAVLEAARPELRAPEPRFDVSACESFDSSLLAVLVELSRQARALERRCAFIGASANLRKLAGLYGIDGLLFAAR